MTETLQNRLRGDRLLDIDRTKGFAIALVVWGHLASVVPSDSPLWFYVSVSIIYSFHMPLFMYLSGLVFFLVGSNGRFWSSPGRYIFSRFDRLILPFIFFGIFVVLGKYFLGNFTNLPDPVHSISDGLLDVLTNSQGNPSASIWYLFVLFVYTLITPLLWKIGGERFSILFLFGVLGWAIKFPEAYYVHRISTYYIFFVIGGFVAHNKVCIYMIFKRFCILFIFAFSLICSFYFDSHISLLVCGILSIPAFHSIFLQNFWNRDRLFIYLGRYTMAIYLLNTICMGVLYVVIKLLYSNDPSFSVILLLVIFISGLFAPILIKKLLDGVRPLRPVARYLD